MTPRKWILVAVVAAAAVVVGILAVALRPSEPVSDDVAVGTTLRAPGSVPATAPATVPATEPPATEPDTVPESSTTTTAAPAAAGSSVPRSTLPRPSVPRNRPPVSVTPQVAAYCTDGRLLSAKILTNANNLVVLVSDLDLIRRAKASAPPEVADDVTWMVDIAEKAAVVIQQGTVRDNATLISWANATFGPNTSSRFINTFNNVNSWVTANCPAS